VAKDSSAWRLDEAGRVIVPRECVADRAEEPHQANLFDVDMKYGDVVDAATVLDHLAKGSVTRA
jgi:hypothetical protein